MKSLVAHACTWWDRFWFEPAGAPNLGVARLLFFGGVFLVYIREDFSGWAYVSTARWQPVWLFQVLSLDVYPAAALRAIEFAFLTSVLLGAVGLFTRPATITAAVLSAYYFGLPHNFGHTYHFDAIIVFAMATLAFARCGDAWSLDRLIALGRGRRPLLVPSGEYTWPSRVVWVLIALVMFGAGASKLRHSGLEWVYTDTLAIFLTRAHYHVSDADPLVGWGLWIAQQKPLVVALAALTIVIEFCFPIALLVPAARWFFVPAAALMLIGIRLLMGPTFGVFLLANVFWVRWDRVVDRIAVGHWPARGAAVIFDGDCGLCMRTVAVLRALDVGRRLAFLDAWRDWPSVHARFPALDQNACVAEMHLVRDDGRIFTGFDAYRALAWCLPLAAPIAPVLYVPGVRAVGCRLYTRIAASRTPAECAVKVVHANRG
jgi:predicted DCC family thiol-disulfide oxidoreductase YuxK